MQRDSWRPCFCVRSGAVVLVGVIASLLAASSVGAERQSLIIFGGRPAGAALLTAGRHGPDGVELNFLPATSPLPRKFMIQVPAGFGLDLTDDPGVQIGDGLIEVVGADSSYASAGGGLLVRDPASYASDPAAEACAPGTHAAIWSFSAYLAGQQMTVTIFIDPGGELGVAYTLQSCPSGLTSGSATSAITISLLGLEIISKPKTAGTYVWRTFVTPQAAPTYELQAVVMLPESITVAARYLPRNKEALLTGKVLEGGQAAAHVHVKILASISGFSPLPPSVYETDTKADGSFAVRAPITRTSDYQARVSPSSGACVGTSTAPGGCAGSTTVPPDYAFTTVWVSVRGGAVRAIRAADQRQAERANLSAADLPPEMENTGGAGGDGCMNQAHESGLKITGESVSPLFVYLGTGQSRSEFEALGLARVYATARQARAAFEHEAVIATARCEVKNFRPKPAVVGLRLRGLAGRLRAFRGIVSAPGLAYADVVFVQRGRSAVRLQFFNAGLPASVEHDAEAKVVARLR